ncbi:unnamed protein product [Adineta steineri]|uniref:Uncharacterized protein n=1 Tax=Adineta steineri TaxID=433720 RepID=A0A814GR92_9BILA|nr:unnamed protein product [Adineta steineri]
MNVPVTDETHVGIVDGWYYNDTVHHPIKRAAPGCVDCKGGIKDCCLPKKCHIVKLGLDECVHVKVFVQMNSNMIIFLTITFVLLFNSSIYAMNVPVTDETHVGIVDGWYYNDTVHHPIKRAAPGCVDCKGGIKDCCLPKKCHIVKLGLDECVHVKG